MPQRVCNDIGILHFAKIAAISHWALRSADAGSIRESQTWNGGRTDPQRAKSVAARYQIGGRVSQRLTGKVAVVTGGSSGLGLATAKRFVDEGAHVFITGRRQSELDAAVRQLGESATGVQGDVAKLSDIEKLYATVKEKKGTLDILFANAGIGELAPIGQITEEHFDKQFNVNVRGLLFTVQNGLTLLRDGGSIVLNASMVSIKGNPGYSIYSATKAAIRSFARTWAVDLKERRIRVNAISPGIVPTPGYAQLGMTQEKLDQYLENASRTIPLGRAGTPDEVAKAVLFLACDDSSYVTGIELFVDGGLGQI